MSSARRVAVVEPLHLNSQRIPQKILQRIGGRRLLVIGVDRLAEIQQQSGADVFVAFHEGDKAIHDAATRAGLGVLPMTREASEGSDWLTIYSGFGAELEDLGYDWAIHTHVVCHPFVRPETMIQAIERCRVASCPFLICSAERTIAWSATSDGTMHEVLTSEFLDSKTSPLLIRPTHLGGACRVEDHQHVDAMRSALPFIPEGILPIELLDCDTLDDLDLLSIVADGFSWRASQAKDTQVDAPDLWCDGPLNSQRR